MRWQCDMCAALGADLDARALVDSALALVAYDSDAANLAGVDQAKLKVQPSPGRFASVHDKRRSRYEG